MRFEDFCDFVQTIVLDEMEQLYEAVGQREWAEVEPVLRRRLDLRRVNFNKPPAWKADYLEDLSSSDLALYEELRGLRKNIALKQQIPAYQVFPNRTLAEMSRIHPDTEDEFREIRGVGEITFSRYGREFLEVIRQFSPAEAV